MESLQKAYDICSQVESDLRAGNSHPLVTDAAEIFALIASGELVIDRQASTPEAFARACEIMGGAE